jgi:hypothetical protein
VTNAIELAVAALLGVAAGWLARSLWSRSPRPPDLPSAAPAPATSTVADSTKPGFPSAVRSRPSGLESRAGGVGHPQEGVGLARRVMVHLAEQGRLGADEVASLAFTQQGISTALTVRQGNLSKVLVRLVAAGALTVDRRHVSGIDRRRLVYRLTPMGESVARELRRPPKPL